MRDKTGDQYWIFLIVAILLIILLSLSGCSSNQCSCECVDCGIACRLQCTDSNCTPGTPCCSECTCDPFSK